MDDSSNRVLIARLTRYRALANDAARLAEGTSRTSDRETYRSIAAQWSRAADELEAELRARKVSDSDAG